MIDPILLLVILLFGLSSATKNARSSRGCYAELRCGGRVSIISIGSFMFIVCLEKTENLSISVQGLPGLRGPEGPPGSICHDSTHYFQKLNFVFLYQAYQDLQVHVV